MAAPALRKKKQPSASNTSSAALRGTDAFKSEENIRLDGSVQGTVHCSKRLVVGEKGAIDGEVKAGTAVISGRITGNLTVDGALQLTSTAKIKGDIQAKRMSVEEGATYNGSCRIGE